MHKLYHDESLYQILAVGTVLEPGDRFISKTGNDLGSTERVRRGGEKVEDQHHPSCFTSNYLGYYIRRRPPKKTDSVLDILNV